MRVFCCFKVLSYVLLRNKAHLAIDPGKLWNMAMSMFMTLHITTIHVYLTHNSCKMDSMCNKNDIAFTKLHFLLQDVFRDLRESFIPGGKIMNYV